MREILNLGKKLIDKYFIFILVALVLISFGQMLFMNVWQDDQALFFKLAHINEPAGYFGAGPFGSGVYRYAATPFIPIYHFFGFNTVAYFSLMLFLYIIATLTIYKVFSLILNKKAGMVAGLFYAAGYITSDSVWRMANSVTTSNSIILTSLILLLYWKFFKSGKISFYIGALLLFRFAIEIALARMHYFFAVIIAFEILFLSFRKPVIKSLFYSLLRISTFFYFFYFTYIKGADQRSGEVNNFLGSILHGQFYQLFGFFGSLGNLIIPDWVTNQLIVLTVSEIPFAFIILFIISAVIFYLLFLGKASHLIWTFIFSFISLVTIIFSAKVFSNPLLNVKNDQVFIATLGAVILLVSFAAITTLKKYQHEFILLSVWLLGNIAAYSAYSPTIAYETINRYLAHSFMAYAGILGIVFVLLSQKTLAGKIGRVLLVILLLGNFINNITYQQNVLATRSYPTKNFFAQLKEKLPSIKEGDIIYFDVAPIAQFIYRDAIAAAMMPNTTSYAWRYGIDRYDFILVDSFDEMVNAVSANKTPFDQVHAFWFDGNSLTDISAISRLYLSKQLTDQLLNLNYPLTSLPKLTVTEQETEYTPQDLIINLNKDLTSTIPLKVSLDLIASSLQTLDIRFPLVLKNDKKIEKNTFGSQKTQLLAIDYQSYLESFYDQVEISTSSDWQDRTTAQLVDNNPESVWQADRVLWANKTAVISISLAQTEEINRIIWINGFPNNTPTDYTIEVSTNNTDWKEVKHVNNFRRINGVEPNIESFDSVPAKYIRFIIRDTAGDSPAIAEMWVVPTRFESLDIEEINTFLANPFVKVMSENQYMQILNSLHRTGTAQLFWMTDKSPLWQTDSRAKFKPLYDGQNHNYQLTIPAGGTSLKKLRLSGFNIPGEISINKITVSQPINNF